MYWKKLKAIGFAPNTRPVDSRLALKLIGQPWKWKNGSGCGQLEERMNDYLGGKGCVTFSTGRGALMAILKMFGVGKDDEVVVQAFTCVAVVNAIVWLGAKPVYADIDLHTLNLDLESLEKAISLRTKAVIVQHTLGCPAPMNEIMAITKRYDVRVIEDCAHAIGSSYEGKKAGNLGDAAFFSFGRDKVISAVFGGIAYMSNPSDYSRLRQEQIGLNVPSYGWIFKQLLYYPMTFVVSCFYSFFGLGKFLHHFFEAAGLLTLATTVSEKQMGVMPSPVYCRMSNVLALLALAQFNGLSVNLAHRKKMAQIYQDRLKNLALPMPGSDQSGHNYMRFSLLWQKRAEVMVAARRKGYVLGDWYTQVVAPPECDLHKAQYRIGSCPNAELAASQIINLPTSVQFTQEDAHQISQIILESI